MPELIALAVPAGPQLVDLIIETWSRGNAFAPVDTRLPAGHRAELLAALAPTELVDIGPGSRLRRRRLAGGSPVAEGDALVLVTSGTGGEPKPVIHTHDSIAASAHATSKALSVDPMTDKWLACLPVAHIGGLSVILRSLVTGTPVEVHDGFDPVLVGEAARSRGVTLVSLVTRALKQVPAELFRAILIGGVAPPDDLPGNVIPTYGMTETGSGVIYGSTVLDGCELMVLDHDREPIEEPNLTGRIAVRGPMLFRGYRSPDGTVTTPFLEGGWFDTGDLGHWSPNGGLIVEGRDADVIVTGGEKVWPAPIEELLGHRPDIAEVALVGRPDPDWGHRLVAVVVPADPGLVPSIDSLKATVTEHFPAWCAPKEVVVSADPLPRTSLGKIRRSALNIG